MSELETYFKGLADGTRLRIVNLLMHGELCGCDIERILGMSQSKISRHLVYLKHAGLVLDRREGFRVFYRLAQANDEPMKGLFRFLAEALPRSEDLRRDRERLGQAIKRGACAFPAKGTRRKGTRGKSAPVADYSLNAWIDSGQDSESGVTP